MIIRLAVFVTLGVCTSMAVLDKEAKTAVTAAGETLCTYMEQDMTLSATSINSLACTTDGIHPLTFTFVGPDDVVYTGFIASVAAATSLRSGTSLGNYLGCDVDFTSVYIGYNLRSYGVTTGDIEIQNNNGGAGLTDNLVACGSYTAWWMQPSIFEKNKYCMTRLEINAQSVDGSLPPPSSCAVADFPA